MARARILLKTLLLSTSRWNIFRHSTDKKKRRQIIGSFIGSLVLYAMLMAYSISVCIGYGQYGMIDAAPVMCALTVSALSFIFSLFRTNGYLFNFKEYDMLMSLPFESKTVAACKFLYMYGKSLPWYLSISLAMMIGYGIYAHPPVIVYPLWLILALILPVIPTLAASFLGFLIARISAGFKKTNLIQPLLTMLFVLFCFFVRFLIEDLLRDEKIRTTLETASSVTNDAARIYLPARWFSDAIIRRSPSGFLLLAGVSAALFLVVFAIVGRSYARINSALGSRAATRRYHLSALKQRRVISAIVFKEWKRMAGSTTYFVNGGMGFILAVIIGILALVIGPDRIIQSVTGGAPLDAFMLRPAIPFIVYFFVGMVSTTTCSPSLEGKNDWILRSLPVERKTVYQGKMLFNMLLAVPTMAFATICICIASDVPAPDTVLCLILGLALCAHSTAWGCVCGIRHMRLDWEHEFEVIKQGAAVAFYMIPNLIVVIGLVVLMVFLGTRMDHRLLMWIGIVIVSILAALSYVRVLRLAKGAQYAAK